MRSILVLTALALFLVSAPAQAGGWQKLGERKAAYTIDRDTILVGAREGKFRSIMFKVDGGAIELYDLNVEFENGQGFSPPTQLIFNDNARSRIIDLPGRERFIHAISFRYRSVGGDGDGARSTVTVFGR